MTTRTVDAGSSRRSRRDGAGGVDDAGRSHGAGGGDGAGRGDDGAGRRDGASGRQASGRQPGSQPARDPRRGGVGTLERPAAPPRSAQSSSGGQPPRNSPSPRNNQAPRERNQVPRDGQALREVRSPRTPGRLRPRPAIPRPPAPGAETPTAQRTTAPAPAAPARAQASQRMPFILLLVGLLGGALVCLLVISTTLDTGAFQISSLQQENSALATQQQELQQAVAKAKSTAVIAQRAYQLGMRREGELRFINLKKRSIATTAAHGVISAPGYTP